MNITLNLEIKEIVFDVQNKTYLTGRAREAESTKGFEAASNMQASEDDENMYQIKRSITSAFADLKSELADYLRDSSSSADNLIKEAIDNNSRLPITLIMPSNFNSVATDNLVNCLHQYIVNKSIAEWFMITNKEDSEGYAREATKNLESTKRALYKRVRPTRPTYAQ